MANLQDMETRFDTGTDGGIIDTHQTDDLYFLKETIVELAVRIDQVVPEGRHKSLALTALEEVQMRATRGITHK